MLHMRYFRLFLTVLPLLFCNLLRAQSLSVESFRLLENDLTANTYGTMERDQNGEVAALIKVVTSETGFVFDGGMMGIVRTIQKTGEIWVYVPRAIQKITITHQQHGVLRDYYFPVTIENARTYEMVLKHPVTTPVRTRAQYVVFKVEPHNAVVLVDNEAHTLNSEGQLSLRLNSGEHTYMVTAPSFETETGTVTVSDSRITKEIKLSSLVGQLTINTDNDAELYIDDEYKGNGTWSGTLNEGTYFVEVRRPSFKTAFEEVSLRRSESRTVTVRATEPAYGDVEVVSDPLDFDIYIDGEKKGVTPDYITLVRTGTHKVTLKKAEYYDRDITVEVFEDSIAYISVSDFQRIPESAKDKKKREALEAKEAKELARAEARARKEAERDAARLAEQAENEADRNTTGQLATQGSLIDKSAFPDVYDVADVMPVFPAGNAALIQYFKDNINCPQYYQGNDRVIVGFIVEKDGYASHPYIVKGIDDVIDREVLRVLEKMPKWTPGINDGRIVRVWQTVNINIRHKGTSSVYLGSNNIGNDSGSIGKRSNRRISYYLGGFYTAGDLESYGVEAGLYYRNFNVQLDYGFHTKQIEGIWSPSIWKGHGVDLDFWKYDYKWKYLYTFSASLGYGINVARPLRVTPQVGLRYTQLVDVDDELVVYKLGYSWKTYCLGAQAAAKTEIILSKNLSIFVTPSYTVPLKLDEIASRLDEAGNSVNTSFSGFKLSAGLNIIF